MLTPEEQHELQRLLRDHIPLRAIARRLGLGRLGVLLPPGSTTRSMPT
jgi:IS30 family transposase